MGDTKFREKLSRTIKILGREISDRSDEFVGNLDTCEGITDFSIKFILVKDGFGIDDMIPTIEINKKCLPRRSTFIKMNEDK